MVSLGSFGPGIIPTKIMFFFLYLNFLGRFCTTKYIAPTEYPIKLKYAQTIIRSYRIVRNNGIKLNLAVGKFSLVLSNYILLNLANN